MCGRYSIAVEARELEKHFGAGFVGAYTPRYNAAPSQNLPVILNESPKEISMVRWGIKPPWMHAIKRDGLINLRSDTLRYRAAFKKDLLDRRCLVLADGFYEWKKIASRLKIPYRFTRKDGAPFAFAGLWEPSHDEKWNGLKAFSIITTHAWAPIRPIHDRMPVILKPEDESIWLSGKTPLPTLWNILQYPESKALKAYEVSRAVNNVKNDSKDLLVPVSKTLAKLRDLSLFAPKEENDPHGAGSLSL